MEIKFEITKKEKIIVFAILTTICLYIFVLPAYPYFLFDKKVSKNNISIYYNDDFDKNDLIVIIDETFKKLQGSHYYDDEMKSDIFICNNKALYIFLNPFNYKGFASNQVRYKNIFVSNANPKENLSFSTFDKNRKEKLINLLAHEINHGFSKKFNGHTLKEWKEEGYSEYIAYDKNVNLEVEFNDTLNKNYWYIKRKSYVYYLLEIKKMKMTDFIKNDFDLEEINKEIENYLTTNL